MSMNSPHFWKENGITAKLLLPLALLYQLGYRLRRLFTRPTTITPNLLCVGNLIAGGAGKTPVALSTGEYIKAQGINACYLSKGYGGSLRAPTLIDPARHNARETGDEPLLLAQVLPTIVAKNRVAGARMAAKQGFELIILDDGFQNPTLKPDVSLVVVDSAYGFGNCHTLPAGPLREPVKFGLKRADALVVLRRDRKERPALTDFDITRIFGDLRTSCPNDFENQKLVAFSGIARPQQFFEALVQHCGAHVINSHSFPDHHYFTETELKPLRDEAHKLEARLITTAKDAVRLPPAFQDEVLVAEASINWHNADELAAVLAPLVTRKES